MSRFAPARRLLWEILAGLLCCAPFLYLCWFSSQFFIDVASSDQWGLVKLIGRYLNGQLSFSDLWMQKNAHRILFPKLIMLPLAKATNWNHGYEVAVIIGCGLISYLLIAQQLVRVYREGSHQRAILWLNAVLLSVLLFSLSQYQNWLWGMQIQIWLCVSAAVGGLFILSASLTTGRVIAALLLGFVATHSFADGLVYWGAGLLPILLAPASSSTQRRRWLAIWLVFATLAVCSFFFGYRSQGSGLGELVHSPLQHLLYTLTYLGNPVAHGSLPLAVAAGVLSLALLVGLSAHLALSKGVAIRALLPFLSLALFALGSAAMTAVGRNDFAVSQALTSRYITIAQLIWVVDITLLCLTLATQRKSQPNRPLAGTAPSALLLVLMLSVAFGHLKGMAEARPFSEALNRAGRNVAAKYPELSIRDVRPLGQRPQGTLKRLPVLYEHELSLFRQRGEAPR